MDSIATTDSNKIQGNKDGDNLLMLNDGSKGSSQLSENIQDFVGKMINSINK